MSKQRLPKISIAIAALAALAILAAGFWLNNYLLQVGTSLAMLAVLCLAWNLVGGYMGYPSLATAALFGLGVYVGAMCQIGGVPIYAAWGLAALAGAAAAMLLGATLLGLKGHYFAIGTVATVEVLREIANNWEAVTGGAAGLNLPIVRGSPELVGRFFYLAMWGLVLLSLVVTIAVAHSRFGFGLRCIKQNENAASMVGIDVFKYKVTAFTLSGVLCAAAGAIYASMVAYVEPKDAFNVILTIEVPVMVMLGGMGTVLGPLIGAGVYVLLREVVWANFIEWHSAILGLIIVLVIYFIPGGLLGTDWRRIWTAATAKATAGKPTRSTPGGVT